MFQQEFCIFVVRVQKYPPLRPQKFKERALNEKKMRLTPFNIF